MENPQIWSVSDVNHAVREIVEGALLPFWMAGEVGSLTLHRSGHAYFTMKDAKSQIRAVYFGGAAACTRLGIANGSKRSATSRSTKCAASTSSASGSCGRPASGTFGCVLRN